MPSPDNEEIFDDDPIEDGIESVWLGAEGVSEMFVYTNFTQSSCTNLKVIAEASPDRVVAYSLASLDNERTIVTPSTFDMVFWFKVVAPFMRIKITESDADSGDLITMTVKMR